MRLRLVLSTVCVLAGGCIHVTQPVTPKVAVDRVATLQPPIAARVLLLLTPAFTATALRSVEADPIVTLTTSYQVGDAAERLVTEWARRSFTAVEVRRLPDEQALRAFAVPVSGDTGAVFLLPRLEPGGDVYDGRFRFRVGLRLDVRSTRTGAIRSWAASGQARNRLLAGSGDGAARALELAMAQLQDSLAAHPRDSL
jgi:hypothetical protein